MLQLALRNQIGNKCLRNAPYSEFKLVKGKEFQLVIKDYFQYIKNKIRREKSKQKKKDKKEAADLMEGHKEPTPQRTYVISSEKTKENKKKFNPLSHVMWLKVCLHTWKEYMMII